MSCLHFAVVFKDMVMSEKPPRLRQRGTPPLLNVWAIAGEVGLIIALPLVGLLLLGIKVDKRLNTTPLFIMVALVSSMVISTVAIARKIRRIQ